MIVAIDIGNTSISLATVRGKTVKVLDSIETGISKQKISQRVTRILKTPKRIDDVVICSVVPQLLKTVELAVKKQTGKAAIVIGRNIKVPIENRYKEPRQVGEDRLVCAYAARELYGTPAVVVDLGTAITFDLVSKTGAYEGGMIVPGIRLSAESLFLKTALLPRLNTIKSPQNLIGKDTRESILSGIFFGYGAMIDGVINKLSQKIKARPKVILTGGYTEVMKKFIAHKPSRIDRNLVFRGINLIYSSS